MNKEQPPLSGSQQKIQEYVGRIRAGESKEAIYDGIGNAFKTAIERGLAEPTEDMGRENMADQQRQDTERLQEIRLKLGIEERQPMTPVSIEDRKKLQGWGASYALARIAQQEQVDLSSLSREEYAEYAIRNSLAIDDSQLRAAPWQRMATSAEEIVRTNKEHEKNIDEDIEKNFARFSYEMMEKAYTNDRSLGEGIRVRQGTKDSNSWLFFGINNGAAVEKSQEDYKAYLSLKNLNTLTPKRFISFMEELRDANYNGDIKIFQDLSEQGIRLNDQIVMHGASEEDAKLALQTAERFFGEYLAHTSLGKDENVNGKKTSYSQILAGRIAETIKNQRGK